MDTALDWAACLRIYFQQTGEFTIKRIWLDIYILDHSWGVRWGPIRACKAEMTSLCNVEKTVENTLVRKALRTAGWPSLCLCCLVTASLPPFASSSCPHRTVYFLQELCSLAHYCSLGAQQNTDWKERLAFGLRLLNWQLNLEQKVPDCVL